MYRKYVSKSVGYLILFQVLWCFVTHGMSDSIGVIKPVPIDSLQFLSQVYYRNQIEELMYYHGLLVRTQRHSTSVFDGKGRACSNYVVSKARTYELDLPIHKRRNQKNIFSKIKLRPGVVEAIRSLANRNDYCKAAGLLQYYVACLFCGYPLHESAMRGNTQGAWLLLIGAGLVDNDYINRIDECGRTALHYAIESCHIEMAYWLIANGADPSIPDCDKVTPSYLFFSTYPKKNHFDQSNYLELARLIRC